MEQKFIHIFLYIMYENKIYNSYILYLFFYFLYFFLFFLFYIFFYFLFFKYICILLSIDSCDF